ncbi:MAG TPA: DUF4149 domain-containing protein [Candidatus Deferrimicrobiaceae bacterium]
MPQAAAAIYRLSVALWAGGMSLFTFVVTPAIFRSRGRDAAGEIVGAIFPHYFRYCLAVIGIALIARIAAGFALAGARQIVGTALVVAALFLSGWHTFVLAPRIEAVQAQVASLESVPPEHPARREFSRLHGISMGVNLAILAAGVVLILGQETFSS